MIISVLIRCVDADCMLQRPAHLSWAPIWQGLGAGSRRIRLARESERRKPAGQPKRAVPRPIFWHIRELSASMEWT